VQHLGAVDKLAPHLNTLIPTSVLLEVDQSRNPANFIRDVVERAATENQFMNGKIQAVEVPTRIFSRVREDADGWIETVLQDNARRSSRANVPRTYGCAWCTTQSGPAASACIDDEQQQTLSHYTSAGVRRRARAERWLEDCARLRCQDDACS
jgi:hypothetical protein